MSTYEKKIIIEDDDIDKEIIETVVEPVISDEELDELDELPDIDVVEIDINNSQYCREITITDPYKRITSNVLSLAEYTAYIGIRTSQIENGSCVYTSIANLDNPYDIAVKELLDRRSPAVVIRKISNTTVEVFKISEMTYNIDRAV